MNRNLAAVIVSVLVLAAGVSACDTLDDILDEIRSGSGHGGGTPPPNGPACGPATCAAGQVCCNASCGICTAPDGVCSLQVCGDPGACQTDSDCRTFSDYCTGCDCRALATGDPDPTCSGPGVQCFVDPCAREHAVCTAGRCAIAR